MSQYCRDSECQKRRERNNFEDEGEIKRGRILKYRYLINVIVM